MTALIIRGGTVIDSTGTRTEDVGVVDDRIVDVAAAPDSATVIDATGCVVSTGLVDLHAHMGEPGDEAAETMESGGRAAVLGGFTTVLVMPNTMPPVDTAAVVEHIRTLANAALCHVEVAGCITVDRAGTHLAPLGELAEVGVRFVTDCGAGVQNPLLLRRALEYTTPFGLTIAQPADCVELSVGAEMHEGEWSSWLGLPGAPSEAEEIMVMRDIALARLTGARLHFQTLSTARSFALVAEAQRAGITVSAEIASHHLVLCDADLSTYDTSRKVEPPLRELSDVAAVRHDVSSGLIDCIVSDHTPHSTDRKERPFDAAEAGSVGLETALAVALSQDIAISQVLRAMSWRPAELLGLGSPSERTITPGVTADLTIIDPHERFTVSTQTQATAGTNSAFEGAELRGRVRTTIVDGRVVVHEGEITQ
ncbi:dihydroorotase [bacterium]|jgi:dihydroorotase|nr:dihydroorotase [bacterium]MDB4102553.1 dihydroorotase [Acidimicrobiales bacterium]MDC1390507.1 dihydroorotase [Acidimicrobiales bacterium]HAY70086.1 dihydroorotase [Acidimicrobiaceae bacterium]